jgi:hypothetical protein
MKTIGSTCLFVIAVVALCGCPDYEPPPFAISLSFQDASGKDLVEGIRYNIQDRIYPDDTGLVEPDAYKLKCSRGEDYPPSNFYTSTHLYRSKFVSGPFVPYSHLYFQERIDNSKAVFTYLLTCPYIFGDDAEHEIVAYCRKKRRIDTCYRLTFDGEDIQGIVSHVKYEPGVAAVIILD